MAEGNKWHNATMLLDESSFRLNQFDDAPWKRRREMRILGMKELRDFFKKLSIGLALAVQNRKCCVGGLVVCRRDHRRFLVHELILQRFLK